ncbi:MAG: phospho-N-acetylmuramoyl-pentapeptide-transferase [bacterium]|nr:phospho-N-acetylmuramoyl-pentapeptide-transferase [bacterium]
MALFLGLVIFSFIITAVAVVPFIDFLYRLRFIRQDESVALDPGDSVAYKLIHKQHSHKIGTPIGGGVLIIGVVAILFALVFPLMSRLGVYISSSFSIKQELNVIFFTFGSFGLLGLYDDILKIFGFKKTGFFGLRVRHKLVIQLLIALAAAALLYFNLKIDIINIPFWGILRLGWLYIPFAALVIVFFANAFDFTDGLDGLSCGVLLICLLAFWALTLFSLDTPLSTFIALWIGSLIAFLYFNVHPARLWLGNAGGLAFGATLAIVGLLLGKIVALVVIGGIFVVELMSSFLQIVYFKSTKGKRLFPIAPLHHWLQLLGWSESKIVMRAWLAAIMLALFGIWLAQL